MPKVIYLKDLLEEQEREKRDKEREEADLKRKEEELKRQQEEADKARITGLASRAKTFIGFVAEEFACEAGIEKVVVDYGSGFWSAGQPYIMGDWRFPALER